MADPDIQRKPMRQQGAFTRAFMRAPISLYKWGLGWMLGGRFIHIVHTGRVSGRPRYVVVEVVSTDKATGTYYVAAAWGEKSDWYRNLMKTPECTAEVGRHKFAARARRISPDEAEEVLLDYAHRHPSAMRTLAGYMGFEVDGSEAGYRAVARQLAILAISPQT